MVLLIGETPNLWASRRCVRTDAPNRRVRACRELTVFELMAFPVASGPLGLVCTLGQALTEEAPLWIESWIEFLVCTLSQAFFPAATWSKKLLRNVPTMVTRTCNNA